MNGLLAIDYQNQMLWAVVLGWVISVVLHEFAHGAVAFLGGDYTIRERGGLSLNPIQYVDPVWSIMVPVIILIVGGIPLPGGVTYVRRDLLRSRAWDVAVSLAGPAMNLLLCAACLAALHPKFGMVDPTEPSTWTGWQIFLGAMGILQLMAAVFNLVPIPPLDGFNAIAEFLPREWVEWLRRPQISWFFFFVFFMSAWNLLVPVLVKLAQLLVALGYDQNAVFIFEAYNQAFFG